MSRLIDNKLREAFFNGKSLKSGNYQIEVLANATILKYHGNSIAFKYNDPDNTISVQNCGWFSNTTKSKLVHVIGADLYQKGGIWFLDGVEWDGKLRDLKNC